MKACLKLRVTETERYNAKLRLIINNLPNGFQAQLSDDVFFF